MRSLFILFYILIAQLSSADAQCPTPPQLIIPGGPNPVLTCINTSVTPAFSSNTPGVTWLWLDNFNQLISVEQNPVITEAGTYTAIITEPINGCTATGNLIVEYNQYPAQIDVPPFVYGCTAPDVTLPVTSFTPNVNYTWSNTVTGFQSNLQNPVVTQPGIYQVVVTAPNGCTTIQQTEVLMGSIFPTVSVPQDSFFVQCNTQTVDVPITFAPADSRFLTPNTSLINGNIMQAYPGLQFVTVVSSTGCQASTAFVVVSQGSAPVVSVVTENINCNNTVPSLTAQIQHPVYQQTFSYLWSNGSTNPTITGVPLGVYTVTVTNTNHGCTAVRSSTLIENYDEATINVVAPCSGNANGQLGNPPQAGVSYLWDNGTTNQYLQNIAAGSYCVTVTNDQLGCTATTCLYVQDTALLSVAVTTIQPTCNSLGSASATVVNGGVPPFTYQWSNGLGNTPAVVMPAVGGTYTVVATDNNGCTGMREAYLNYQGGAAAIIVFQNNTDCTVSSLLIHVATGASQPTDPLSYLWSNGSTESKLDHVPFGTYAVTVTGNNGCTAIGSATAIDTTNCDLNLYGYARNDLNINCIADQLEPPLNNWIVRATNQANQVQYFANTDTAGYYQMGLPVGNYLVEMIPTSQVWTSCAGTLVQINPTDSLQVNLAAKATYQCPVLQVDLSTPFLRRCMPSTYVLRYCNLGSDTVENAYIDLKLDPFLTYQTSSIPATLIGADTLRFQVGNLIPGACSTISMQVLVSCDAQLGQTHCSEAHIFPDTICWPVNTAWSGATVAATSVCQGDSLLFVIKNTGNTAMTNALEYIVIEDGILRQSSSAPPLPANGTMIVKVPANGSTWRIEANQEVNHPILPNAIVNSEGCTDQSTPFSTGFINQFSLPDSMPWLDIDCTENIGSFDPNDKLGIPVGYGNLHYVESNTAIDFLIRFQNTGTDTAFTVIVQDTLDAHFDPATFKVLGYSHPVKSELSDQGMLHFQFDQIMLPDSNINEAASHGFIRYQISPKNTIHLETDVFNQASIFFDFNAPILTNKTQHRYGQDFVSVHLLEADFNLIGRVQPNPVIDQVQLIWQYDIDYTLQIIDATGKMMQSQTGQGTSIQLNLSGYQSGIYIIRLVGSDQKIRFAKIVKM
jgi:uncharacterized repeat protein (TIGR01451 family)